MRFRERLVPGVGTRTAVLLLLPAVYVIALPLSEPLLAGAVAVVATVAVEVLLTALAPVIAVSDGVLSAGAARIPVRLTGATTAYARAAATEARGTGLDARAFTVFRGWVDPVVRIDLTDPDDPTPYWLVSTRRPEELRAALEAERAATAA